MIAIGAVPALADPPALPAPLIGAIPGFPGYAVDDHVDATYCGGHRLTVRAPKVRPKDVPPELDAALRFAQITGLDLRPDADAAAHKAELDELDRQEGVVFDASHAALKVLRERGGAPGASSTTKLEAMAGIIIVARRLADVLGRPEIPRGLRSKAAHAHQLEYCKEAVRYTRDLWDQAAEEADDCARFAARIKAPPGWWRAICVAPSP